MAKHTDTRPITVASGGTSGFCQLEDWDTDGLIVPALTSSTLTIKVSDDNVTYYSLRDEYDVATLTYAASTGSFVVGAKSIADVTAFRYLGVFCGTAQGAARTFTLCFKAPRRS
jgi:hypothetical protein